MKKILFKNKEEFDSFIDENTGLDVSGHELVKKCCWTEEPKKYPCIAIWEIPYNENGPDRLEYKLVYLEDFE